MLTLRQFDKALANICFAMDAGQQGRLVLGYDCLLLGLREAQESTAEGNPWGPELVRIYSHALEIYTERYRICLADPEVPELRPPAPG